MFASPQSSAFGATDEPTMRSGGMDPPVQEPRSVLKRVLRLLGVGALAGAALALLAVPLEQQTRIPNYTLDFACFYMAGRIARSGQWNRLYDLGLERRIERSVSRGGPFMPYNHTPFEALLYVPLASLTFPHAFVVWGILNIIAAVGIMVFLPRALGYPLSRWRYVLWLLICVFFAISEIAGGQDLLWVAVVFLLAFLAMKRGRDYVAGLALGLGLFRFEILLPFAFIFLLRRRWKLLAGFSAMGALALVLSLALVGWNGLMTYLRVLFEVGLGSRGAWADRSSAIMMPTLRGILQAVFEGTGLRHFMFPIVLLATVCLLIWAASRMRNLGRPEGRTFDLEFSLAIVAALLASYHLFIDELTPLMIVGFLILAYEQARPDRIFLARLRGSALLLLFLAMIAGLVAVHSQKFSVEAITLAGLMAWLSREIAAPEGHVGSS